MHMMDDTSLSYKIVDYLYIRKKQQNSRAYDPRQLLQSTCILPAPFSMYNWQYKLQNNGKLGSKLTNKDFFFFFFFFLM